MANEPIKPFTRTNRPSLQGPPTGAAPGTATSALPPAGHERKETLKRRADVLEQQAEAQHANMESIDPDAFEIERELAGHFNQLDVTGADPAFCYKWVNFSSNNGLALREAVAPPERWQVVTGDMPEAIELKAVDGTRKLGDVLLVRMPKSRYAIIEKVRADKAARQLQGHESNLRAMGQRHQKHIKVYGNDELPERVQKKLTNPSTSTINAMRGAEAASKQFDQALRDGSIAV